MVLGVLVGHVTVITQRQFQQFVEFLVTLHSRPWRSHSYSSWDGRRRACCCASAGALVGSCRKLWSFRSCIFGCRPVLDKVVVPLGATTVSRAMLGSTFDTCYFPGRLLAEFSDFLREGVDSALELDSRLAFVAGTSSTTAVACTFLVLMVSCTSRYVPTIACGLQRSVQSMLRLLAGLHLEICTLFSTSFLDLSACSAFEFLRESIFWSPRALTSVCARGLEYRSRQES